LNCRRCGSGFARTLYEALVNQITNRRATGAWRRSNAQPPDESDFLVPEQKVKLVADLMPDASEHRSYDLLPGTAYTDRDYPTRPRGDPRPLDGQ
jgi:hypothetical protein